MLLRLFCAIALAFGSMAVAGSARAAPPLEVYGRLPEIELAAISPSGKRIAIVGFGNLEHGLTVLEDGKPIIRTALGEQKFRSLTWAGDDKLLIEMGQTVTLGMGFTADKTEVSAVLVVPLSGAPIWWVFAGNHNITGGVNGFYGVIGDDFRHGYFGGVTLAQERGGETYFDDGRPELYQVDLDTKKIKLVAHRLTNADGWRDWLLAPDGTVYATLDFLSKAGQWGIRNADGKTIATGSALTGGIGLIGLGRTPGTIVYSLRNAEDGSRLLMEQPVAGGLATEILSEEPIRGYHIDRRTLQLIGYVRDGDIPEDHFFDPKREKMMAATRKAFPGLAVQLMEYDDDFTRLLLRTSGPGDPDTWWILDTKARSAVDIGTAYRLTTADVGPMRMVKYKAADGLDMAGVLTLPPGREPRNLPLIMLPHGGPTARDYPDFYWWAQAFASRGYAVFQPNFRGSLGSGAAFVNAGDGEWGRKMQTDISDGMAELAKQGIVDPKRACIVGASYGGYAALAGVTLQQGFYKCAVSVAGIGDVGAMVRTDTKESAGDATLTRGLKKEVGSGRDLKLISPITYATRADAPILLIHGADDTVVAYTQSTNMMAALKRAGRPVEMVTLPGEDHWLSKSETRLTMLKAAVSFVEKYNPPDPAESVK